MQIFSISYKIILFLEKVLTVKINFDQLKFDVESFLYQLNGVKEKQSGKSERIRANTTSEQLKVLFVIRRKRPSFNPVCIGCLLHNTIQLAVERSVLHYTCSSGGLISLEKACRSLVQSKVDTSKSRPCVVVFQQRSKHTTLCHSSPSPPLDYRQRIALTTRARMYQRVNAMASSPTVPSFESSQC